MSDQSTAAKPKRQAFELLAAIDAAIMVARGRAEIGARVPEMSRQPAAIRMLARPFMRALLRTARIVTREQHAFNVAVIDALEALRQALLHVADDHAEVTVQVGAGTGGARAGAGGTAYPHADFPPLTDDDLDGARLFADRKGLIRAQEKARGGVVAEVGVALGDFTEVILSTLEPRTFYGIDLFKMHEEPAHWGRSSKEIFGGKTHRQLYEDRFGARVVIEEGLSHVALGRLPDASCDLIYLDAAHDYENVSRDARAAATKLAPDGTLVFNDYIMFDHLIRAPYGVVQTVNELVASGGWRVTGFALQQHMFCDIALVRRA